MGSGEWNDGGKEMEMSVGGSGDGGRECAVFANVFPCKRIARLLKNLCRKKDNIVMDTTTITVTSKT